MDSVNSLKKKLTECIENGIELDSKGHALLRMDQRKVDFETVKDALKSYDKMHYKNCFCTNKKDSE